MSPNPPGPPPDLALVVAVHNDGAGLARLLQQTGRLGIAAQVVVVDDGSDPPCALYPGMAFARRVLPGVRIDWLRTQGPEGRACGAGAARNLGLAEVRTPLVLFFDADDMVTGAIRGLLADLTRDWHAHGPFDMALFAHHDSRMLAQGRAGPQEPPDRALWAQHAPGPALRALDRAGALAMCRVSNYPWNRIWRTGFLRDAGVRFTESMLHNDIAPHWAGFLSGQRLLCSGRACAIHTVVPGRAQLSARRGRDRLAAFDALDAVLDRLLEEVARDAGRAAFAGPLLDFTCRLTGWIATRLDDPGDIAALQARARGFMVRMAQAENGDLARAVDTALGPGVEPGLAARLLSVLGAPSGAFGRTAAGA